MRLECAIEAQRPASPPPEPAVLKAALDRALDAARDVQGDYTEGPWGFHIVEPEQVQSIAWLGARTIQEDAGVEAALAAYDQWRSVPGWVVVTCQRAADPERQEHLRERCLTAVQRVSLSLWAESVRTSWVTEHVFDENELYRCIGADATEKQILGIMWFGHVEGRGA